MGCVSVGGSYEVINYVDLSQFYVSFQYYVFNMLLITLLVMHLYWWVLILRMVVKQLRNCGKVGEDVRSGFIIIQILNFFLLSFEALRQYQDCTICSEVERPLISSLGLEHSQILRLAIMGTIMTLMTIMTDLWSVLFEITI